MLHSEGITDELRQGKGFAFPARDRGESPDAALQRQAKLKAELEAEDVVDDAMDVGDGGYEDDD